MKIKVRSFVGLLVIVAIAGFGTSCQKEDTAQYASILDVSSDGTSTVVSQNMALVLTENLEVTEDGLSSLLKMKEEEKLARDVYSFLYQKWGSAIFLRISNAENNHLNAIISLIGLYGSPDTLVNEAGIFSNDGIRSLYDQLTAHGSESLVSAYTTGALVEEMDIKDLNDELSDVTDENIILVYENLAKGSRNHLRAFYSQLNSLGDVYAPAYLTQEDYDQIVASAMENGKKYKMKGKGGGSANCNSTGQMKRVGKS